MGFCRRCGDILSERTTRCKCGGSSVAPVVRWSNTGQKDCKSPDKWAETYVLNDADCGSQRPATPFTSTNTKLSPVKTAQERSHNDTSKSPTRRTRRFPRPLSTVSTPVTLGDNRISHHISSTTVKPINPPAKHDPALSSEISPGNTPPDVIASPENATLAKVYGSVLQLPETLPIHTCASCASVFLPDATIYPDPQTPSGTTSRFLCRPCFASHGGSKGPCSSCGRDVLTVTKEGGFIENAGKVWHNRCFRCEGCDKDIGNAPMVDLLGRPSCAECFDTCLERKGNTRARKKSDPYGNVGGLGGRSREGSPVLEELTERLGIKRLPVSDSNSSPHQRLSVSPPGRRRDSASTRDENKYSASPPAKGSLLSNPRSRELPDSVDFSRSTPEPATPDLSSTSNSVSSDSPSTPSRSPIRSSTPNSCEDITPKAKGNPSRLSIVTDNDAKCGRCSQSLFNVAGGGKIVTIPSEKPNNKPTSFHAACFRCVVCGRSFNEEGHGQATFLRVSQGVCHPKCSVSTEYALEDGSDRQDHNVRLSSPDNSSNQSAERPPMSAPPLTRTFPRLGRSETCPGCHKPVSLMEYGVVPGPQNTRWHGSCLVCGGKGSKLPRPGCGKRLDSGAKMDQEGKVWCRECTLLLPAVISSSPQASPTRGTLFPSYTGSGLNQFPRPPEGGRLFGQITGNTVMGSDALTMQLTRGRSYGSVSPTRQMTRSVSPTKGLIPVTKHSRPMGIWKHKSVDEGRGMFLVRQMTGNGL